MPTEEEWLERHREQLEFSALPQSLWTLLAQKVIGGIYDAGSYIEFHRVDSSKKRCQFRVVAKENLNAAADVFLINHVWSFESVEQASEHVHDKTIKGLIPHIVQIFDLNVDNLETGSSSTRIQDKIMNNLVNFAYPHTIRSGELEMTHYSVYDELGSRLQFSESEDTANVEFVTIFELWGQRFLSMIYPNKSIKKQEELKRIHAPRIQFFQGGKDYWTDRFETEEQCEWLAPYCALKPIIDNAADCDRKVDHCIILGCGNSTMGYDMNVDGYAHLTSVDYAENVIEKMKLKYGTETPNGCMAWHTANICALPKDIFPNEKFSLALDKGTLDAFLALGESGWINPNEENNDDLSWVTAMKNIQDYLKEVSRILKTNGVFVVISLGSPEFRVSLLENNNLEVLQIKLLEATGKFDKLSENEMLRLKWNGQFHDKYVYVCSPVTA